MSEMNEMALQESATHWPGFWSDVPEEDRPGIREVLAELLSRGVVLGDQGSGRDLYLLVRDHYKRHITDYLSPLGLTLVVEEEHGFLQAKPLTESCLLMANFTKDESLVMLTLWRVWDEVQNSQTTGAVILSMDELWSRLKVYFDQIDPPEKTQIENILTKLKRHRLVRTQKPELMTQPGELQIEILPSLVRVIPFDDLDAWSQRVELCLPQVGVISEKEES